MNVKLESAMQEKSLVVDDLLKIPGVTAVDVGYKYVKGKRTDEISIRVHVAKKKKTVDKAELIPSSFKGIKTDVIEGTYVPQIVTEKQVITVEPQADTVKYRPLKGGISIGPDRSVGGYIYAGTLGCMVKDNSTGKSLMLSNFHVMCIDSGWHAGDQMDQPSLIDTGTHADGVGTLLRAVLSTHVDGAVASINAGISSLAQIADIGNVAGTAATVLGSPVRKRGRTTLLTYGFVDGVNGSVNIDYGDGIGVKTLNDQITVRPDTTNNPKFSDHGDSGSVVVDSTNKVIGLLFAGSSASPYLSIVNPIDFVESELDVKVLKWFSVKKLEKLELKEFKLEKKEIKEQKLEKIELKEHKVEKIELKELDKIYDKIDPTLPTFSQAVQTSELEQRIQELEGVVTQLTSFIASNLRPDLSQGALENE